MPCRHMVAVAVNGLSTPVKPNGYYFVCLVLQLEAESL